MPSFLERVSLAYPSAAAPSASCFRSSLDGLLKEGCPLLLGWKILMLGLVEVKDLSGENIIYQISFDFEFGHVPTGFTTILKAPQTKVILV